MKTNGDLEPSCRLGTRAEGFQGASLTPGSQAASCPEQPPRGSLRRGQCPHPSQERLSACSSSDVPVLGNSVLARTVLGSWGWELGGHRRPWDPGLLGPGAVSLSALAQDTGTGSGFPEVRGVWAGWGNEILRCPCLGSLQVPGSRLQQSGSESWGPMDHKTGAKQ